MFFSARQLYDSSIVNQWELTDFDGKDLPVSLNRIKAYVRACKKAIVNREQYASANDYSDGVDVFKWLRPWHVVPSLAEFKAPDGEYAVGVEVEACFSDRGKAVANKVQHWKNIAIDFEGNAEMMEVTFPPTLYNKMSSKQQHFRYLKLLSKDSTWLDHNDEDCDAGFVGIHVNVSKGGCDVNYDRVGRVTDELRELSEEENLKYFGREPYSYANSYGGNYVEFKLFNSTTDSKVLRRYIHIAVALADIIYGEQEITIDLVRSALSTAYNKR